MRGGRRSGDRVVCAGCGIGVSKITMLEKMGCRLKQNRMCRAASAEIMTDAQQREPAVIQSRVGAWDA